MNIEEIILFELKELEIDSCSKNLDFEIEKDLLLQRYSKINCPHCNKKSIKKQENSLICSKCNYKLYIN